MHLLNLQVIHLGKYLVIDFVKKVPDMDEGIFLIDEDNVNVTIFSPNSGWERANSLNFQLQRVSNLIKLLVERRYIFPSVLIQIIALNAVIPNLFRKPLINILTWALLLWRGVICKLFFFLFYFNLYYLLLSEIPHQSAFFSLGNHIEWLHFWLLGI